MAREFARYQSAKALRSGDRKKRDIHAVLTFYLYFPSPPIFFLLHPPSPRNKYNMLITVFKHSNKPNTIRESNSFLSEYFQSLLYCSNLQLELYNFVIRATLYELYVLYPFNIKRQFVSLPFIRSRRCYRYRYRNVVSRYCMMLVINCTPLFILIF